MLQNSTRRSVVRSLKRFLTRSPVRPIARLVYRFTIQAELGLERLLDGVGADRQERSVDDAQLLDGVTLVVKAFERAYAARRLIDSVRRLYPTLRIVLVDDSHRPLSVDGVETIPMAFDSGVSAGRNAGLLAVRTEFVLIADDDFVFTRRTRIADSVRELKRHPEIDILGGRVLTLPTYESSDATEGALYPSSARGLMATGTRLGRLIVREKVPNFFLGRAERVRLVGWDPELKRLDHADFFTRAKGVLVTALDRELVCLHVPDPFDAAYLRFRLDCRGDLAILERKYLRARTG